jgi:beta-1,4-mannooligosaccharide phosphorylase
MRATLYFAVPEDMIVPYAAETTEQATHSGMRIVFCETPRAEAIVGPVRKYSIGAVLLDKRDPSKVLARSCEPLVRPEPSEREGYVPNVVYTCGAMRQNDQKICKKTVRADEQGVLAKEPMLILGEMANFSTNENIRRNPE